MTVSIQKIAKLDDKQLHQYARKYGSFSRKGQREFAAFLPEINRRELFLKHKYYTISHYAAVYGSLNKKTVEAVLYVAKKLEDKPVLLELLPTQGWSKLRVICTVATVRDQEFWKEKVGSMSKSALETFVSELKKQGDLVDGKLLGGANARAVSGGASGGASGAGAADSFADDTGNPGNMALNKQNMTIEESLPGERLAVAQESLPEAQNGTIFADFSAAHSSGAVLGEKALIEQGNAGCGKPESAIGQIQPELRNNISFKVTTEVEKQLRLFKYNLGKSKKQAVDWNQVMQEFLRIKKENEALASEMKILKRAQERGKKNTAQKRKTAMGAEQTTVTEVKNIAAQPDNSNPTAKKAASNPTIEEIKKSLPEKSTRHISAKVDQFLQKKYKGMCGYPDCKNPAEIRQHTRRYKLFPNHDPDFIVPLCKKHDQLAHLGLIENEEKQPINSETGAKNWKIQIYADKNAPKYKIDQIVNKFRRAAD